MQGISLPGKDIRYRGFLTNRGLRLIALIAMTCSQISSIVLLAVKAAALIGKTILPSSGITLLHIMKGFGAVSFPLLLISSLAMVLDGRESFGKMILTYFILAVLTYAGIVWFLSALIDDIMVSELPVFISSLATEMQIDKVPHVVLTGLLKNIIPGDGTFHPENISNFLSSFGISIQFPDEETIVGFLELLGIDSSLIDALSGIVKSLDPETVSTSIENFSVDILQKMNLDLDGIWKMIQPSIIRMIHSRLNLNVYWDLFLYTTFFFFVCHKPKNCEGGKMILFRACAAFPAGWLLISAIVSGSLHISNSLSFPDWFVALLSGRNFASLAVFFLLVLFEKYREAEYNHLHPDEESWLEFQDSRRSSLQFSICAAIIVVVVSAVDYLLSLIPGLSSWGIGTSYRMWIAAPILLLFSYNRKPKIKFFNIIIPIYYVFHFIIVVFFTFAILYIGVNEILGTSVL